MYFDKIGIGFGPRKYGIYLKDCLRALLRLELRSWIRMCIDDTF